MWGETISLEPLPRYHQGRSREPQTRQAGPGVRGPTSGVVSGPASDPESPLSFVWPHCGCCHPAATHTTLPGLLAATCGLVIKCHQETVSGQDVQKLPAGPLHQHSLQSREGRMTRTVSLVLWKLSAPSLQGSRLRGLWEESRTSDQGAPGRLGQLSARPQLRSWSWALR